MSFRRIHTATLLGLSRVGECLPLLLRAALALLFGWYIAELWNAANAAKDWGAEVFVATLVILFVIAFLAAMFSAYFDFDWSHEPVARKDKFALWPFLLANLLVAAVIAGIGAWPSDPGILGYTQRGVYKIAEAIGVGR